MAHVDLAHVARQAVVLVVGQEAQVHEPEEEKMHADQEEAQVLGQLLGLVQVLVLVVIWRRTLPPWQSS